MERYNLSRKQQRIGFTLIEILAALSIFSLAIIGLMHASTHGAQTAYFVRVHMLAGVVADNHLSLARLQPPRIGVRSGQEDQMAHSFDYEITTSPTDIPNFIRLEVHVRLKDDNQLLVSRIAFMELSYE